MNKYSKIVLFLMVAALTLSACKVATITPPVEEPTAIVDGTEPTTDVIAEPTEDPDPQPTADLPLIDDDGNMICSIVEPLFSELTPEQEAQLAVFPPVTEDEYTKGPEDAIITIIEYTEFQCPYCAMAYQEFENLMEMYPEDVRLVYRPYPLISIHPNAQVAAQAAEAAGLQGKFWEMYSNLFDKQSEWNSLTIDEFRDWLAGEATALGLDEVQFTQDTVSDVIVEKIQNAMDYAQSIGLNSVPTVLINGRPISNWQASGIKPIIEVVKVEDSLMKECPPWVIDVEKTYTATIKTENGDMTIELYPEFAPLAVNSFVYLAREGFYDGVTFHRVYRDFMAQTGDPTGTGWSGAGYQYREEIADALTFDEPYMLGVARGQGEATSGSQFFITYVPYPTLNGLYTIFGKLVDGVDVFELITERDADQNPDAPLGDEIISITITEE
jgi:cyclophilin family peptidyl-prolyl cis-trans isomerase/protein-disulfide isomerase